MATYTVKRGDTLSDIAERVLGDPSRYREIAELNGIRNPDMIHVGATLTLPSAGGSPAPNMPLPRPKPEVRFEDQSLLADASRFRGNAPVNPQGRQPYGDPAGGGEPQGVPGYAEQYHPLDEIVLDQNAINGLSVRQIPADYPDRLQMETMNRIDTPEQLAYQLPQGAQSAPLLDAARQAPGRVQPVPTGPGPMLGAYPGQESGPGGGQSLGYGETSPEVLQAAMEERARVTRALMEMDAQQPPPQWDDPVSNAMVAEERPPPDPNARGLGYYLGEGLDPVRRFFGAKAWADEPTPERQRMIRALEGR